MIPTAGVILGSIGNLSSSDSFLAVELPLLELSLCESVVMVGV